MSPNVFDVRGDIVRKLQQDGFDVVAVRMSPSSWFGGYTNDLEIECNVFTRHTAEEVRQRAIQVIESITRSFGTTIKVFWNTTLSVARDDYRPEWEQPTSSTNNQTSNTNNQTPAQIIQIPAPVWTGGQTNTDKSDGQSLWEILGIGAGVGVPLALGGLLLIFLMRR